jgi:hypothetical protein
MAHAVRGLFWSALMTVLWACQTPQEVRVYGAHSTAQALSAAAKPVSQLAATDNGAQVTASGTISRVCQTMGCWFYLAEGESLVYVDLEQGASFTIPMDSRGKRAVVAGTYRAAGGDVRIVAKSAAVWP